MNFKSAGTAIISSAIIWGAVMIGCAFILRGTGCYEKISNILIGGASFHIIFIWPMISYTSKKAGSKKDSQISKNPSE